MTILAGTLLLRFRRDSIPGSRRHEHHRTRGDGRNCRRRRNLEALLESVFRIPVPPPIQARSDLNDRTAQEAPAPGSLGTMPRGAAWYRGPAGDVHLIGGKVYRSVLPSGLPKSDPEAQPLLTWKPAVAPDHDLDTVRNILARHARIVQEELITSSGRTLFRYSRPAA
jgi:hypothetical protein